MKPKAGTRGVYTSSNGEKIGFEIIRVEGNLCWSRYDNDPETCDPFIWRFHDGLNTMHDWPGKND